MGNSSTIFSLSASYLGLPRNKITAIINKYLDSSVCHVNDENYLECNKKDSKVSTFQDSTLHIDFDSSMVSFELSEFTISSHLFNIKATPNNVTVLGEPFFLKNYVYFDF